MFNISKNKKLMAVTWDTLHKVTHVPLITEVTVYDGTYELFGNRWIVTSFSTEKYAVLRLIETKG